MHDILLSFIQGIIEGITEFLPISSTAHLRISQAMMGIKPTDEFWKMYTIVIQLGAILCLPIYFRERIIKFLRTFPRGENNDRTVLTHPLTLVCIAFVVTALPAFLLKKKIGENLENYYVMGGALLIGGIVMWLVDNWFGWIPASGEAQTPAASKTIISSLAADETPTAPPIGLRGTATMEEISLAQAVWIGAVQILSAVFPGTSRSMSTIAAGQVAGISRPAALEFSFFLSMPTMIVATVYDFLKTVVLKKGSAARGLAADSDGCASVDRAGCWVHRILLRRLGGGGVVYELGAAARVFALCGVSHLCRGGRADSGL